MQPDIVDYIRRDHQRIKQMMTDLPNMSPETRRYYWEVFRDFVLNHEKREQLTIHPLLLRINQKGLDKQLVGQEIDGAYEIQRIEDGLRAASINFAQEFPKLRSAILQHAENEEKNEHPLIRRHFSQRYLIALGRFYEHLFIDDCIDPPFSPVTKK